MTSTGGTSSTAYGFTGETTDANGLVYLRARYYSSGTGRFLSRDTWGGDTNHPLSLNRWMYVEGNPVNLVDPSGLASCQVQGNYCILKKGGFIDIRHYRAGRDMAKMLLKALDSHKRWGINDEPLELKQSIFPIPFTNKDIEYPLEYRTSIPENGLPNGYQIRNRVALGMFMDYQIRYEKMQGWDPRCHNEVLELVGEPVFDGYCSSFASEDLPSDYLGFLDAIREDINFDSIIATLGGGNASANHPLGYFPKNHSFSTIKYYAIDECHEMAVFYRRIPTSWRNLLPFEPGKFWDVPNGYERIPLFPWL